MPSANSLALLARLVGFVALAYVLSVHRQPTLRGIAASVLLAIGVLGCYEGFVLGAREDYRNRYGRVLPGVVVEKYQTDGHGHSLAANGRQGPTPGGNGLLLARAVAHWIGFRSAAILRVDYRFPCDAGRGGASISARRRS